MIEKIIKEINLFYPNLSEKQYVIEKYVKMTINKVKSFCNRCDIPGELEDVIFMIVVDMLISNDFIVKEKEVSSITRGDTSFSYVKKKEEYEANFLRNYESQLIKFRKMNIPKESKMQHFSVGKELD